MTTPKPHDGAMPELPEPDTTWYANWANDRVKFHSTDQIYEFASARVRAALASQQVVAVGDHYCNKCGYIGRSAVHPGCDYDAAQRVPVALLQEPVSDKVIDAMRTVDWNQCGAQSTSEHYAALAGAAFAATPAPKQEDTKP